MTIFVFENENQMIEKVKELKHYYNNLDYNKASFHEKIQKLILSDDTESIFSIYFSLNKKERSDLIKSDFFYYWSNLNDALYQDSFVFILINLNSRSSNPKGLSTKNFKNILEDILSWYYPQNDLFCSMYHTSLTMALLEKVKTFGEDIFWLAFEKSEEKHFFNYRGRLKEGFWSCVARFYNYLDPVKRNIFFTNDFYKKNFDINQRNKNYPNLNALELAICHYNLDLAQKLYLLGATDRHFEEFKQYTLYNKDEFDNFYKNFNKFKEKNKILKTLELL